jgi:hypothetical protein
MSFGASFFYQFVFPIIFLVCHLPFGDCHLALAQKSLVLAACTPKAS